MAPSLVEAYLCVPALLVEGVAEEESVWVAEAMASQSAERYFRQKRA